MAKDLRQKIIDSAIEIGAKQGLAEVTNSSVAARCKVSTAATYYHFKNKYEIVLQTSLYVSRKLSDYIETHTDYSSDFERMYRTAQKAFIQYQLANKSRALFYYQVTMSHIHVLKPSYADVVADFCPITKIIRRGSESGQMRQHSVASISVAYYPMYTFILECHRSKHNPPEEEIDELIDMMWEAMSGRMLVNKS